MRISHNIFSLPIRAHGVRFVPGVQRQISTKPHSSTFLPRGSRRIQMCSQKLHQVGLVNTTLRSLRLQRMSTGILSPIYFPQYHSQHFPHDGYSSSDRFLWCSVSRAKPSTICPFPYCRLWISEGYLHLRNEYD